MFVPEATLDFHDEGPLVPEQVHFLIDKFISESLAQDNLQVLIITGKGNNSTDGKSHLRPLVLTYLQRHKLVAKVTPAPAMFGGIGALAVYLTN